MIGSIGWRPVQPPGPRFFHCHATIQPRDPATGRRTTMVTGGTSTVPEVALAKAIGESVERHSLTAFDPSPLRVAAWSDLRDDAVDPRRFVQFHEAQYNRPGFAFARLSPASRVGWVAGRSLTRRRPVLVPATVTLRSYRPRTADDRFEHCPVSGYACGNTLEEAVLAGLCEVVERDAFMIFWHHWLPVPAVDRSALARGPAATEALAAFRGVPARVCCADITTDVGIPAVLAAMTSRHPGWPAAVVATAAAPTVDRAAAAALSELAANHLLVGTHLAAADGSVWDTAARLPRGPWDLRDMKDHGLLFARAEFLPYLDPILRPRESARAVPSGPATGPSDAPESTEPDAGATLERLVRRLDQAGLEVVVVEMTVPEVRELGFRVVKVLVPGMQPIDFCFDEPHLGGRRLYEAPRRMGHRGAARHPGELNRFPHPFP